MVDCLKHQLFDFLRIFGIRDRLRCPNCHSVGTWKPHGGWLDFKDTRKVRRWLCKWCGFYVGPEGYQFCQFGKMAWEIAPIEPGSPMRDTPQSRVHGVSLGISPWIG